MKRQFKIRCSKLVTPLRSPTQAQRLAGTARWLLVIAVAATMGTAFRAAELAPKNGSQPKRSSELSAATNSNSAISARPFVKEWTVSELVPIVNPALKGGRNFERGKKLFTEASCALCHHFGPDGGGVGPDLTGVSGSFSVHDLLEAIIEPSKQVSSLYATTVVKKKDGEILTGWVPEETDDTISIMENMFGEGKLTIVKREEIDSLKPSPTSLMPEGLLNTLKVDEVLDLVAFLLSGGDSKQKMFR